MATSSSAAPHAYYGHIEGASVLRLTGPIRFVAAQGLRHFVDDVIAGQTDDGVIIDLRSVEMIDSTGMGLLARIGRASLLHHGRRAIIVCPNNDVATSLRSAAFDELFHMVEAFPFEDQTTSLPEVALDALGPNPDLLGLGKVLLDAHRDLAGVNDRNMAAYRDVIAALEADLAGRSH